MLKYYIASLIVALSFCETGHGLFTSEEGPFELIVHNTSSCLEKQQPSLYSNVTAYTRNGRSLLRGTVITKRDIKNVTFRIRLYYMENNQQVKVFEIKNQKCHNVIVKLVLSTIKLPFDPIRCTMKPNTLEFNNLDLNAVVHSVGQSTWYGNVSIRWEVAMAGAPLMCLDISLASIKANATTLSLSQK